MDTLREAFEDLREILAFAPDSVVALVILSLAVVLALGVHAIVVAVASRFLSWRQPYLPTFVARTNGLTRIALLLLFVRLAIPAAPLSPENTAAFGKFVVVAFVAFIGWTVVTILHIAADIHLRRFRLDVTDNLLARKHVTQVRILLRAVDTVVILITVAAALMSFESVRQYGVSLFASAGVAGLVAGLAARPLLSNLFAGVQLAVTQPIRIDDVLIVEGEFGTVEEIGSTYVVLRLWDWRRMVVPLNYFMEKPFQNWTRVGAALIGNALIRVDYAAPVDAIREQARKIVEQSEHWDKQVFGLQVTDASEETIELRILASAASAGAAFNLRCDIREKLIAFIAREYPDALPLRRRVEVGDRAKPDAVPAAASPDRAGEAARTRARA